VSRSFGEILHHLRDDVQLAERLQQAKFPLRFPDIDGLGVTHRYLAGMKSGGDHFDIAESRDRKTVSLVLTDSSSYGLSGQVLSVLMRVALKLSAEESRSAARLVECVKSEILLTLKDNADLRSSMGQKGRAYVQRRFSHHSIRDAWIYAIESEA
jgi:serine phosphatase RsbU (regulator of sigma subunit)